MKKNVKILIGIGVFLILVGGVIFIFQNKTNVGEKFKESIIKERPAGKATLIIDFGEEKIERFDRKIEKGMTVFDLLKEEAEKSGLTLKTKTYDIGIFIEAIGVIENGQDGKYWLYYINGELPMVSVDKKELKPGDKVEFKFENSPF